MLACLTLMVHWWHASSTRASSRTKSLPVAVTYWAPRVDLDDRINKSARHYEYGTTITGGSGRLNSKCMENIDGIRGTHETQWRGADI